MNKKKIFFFDIDGTLVTEEKVVPKTTKKAIQYLQEKGHYIVIATGRAPSMFHHIREDLDIHSYIALNGQLVVCDGVEIYSDTLDPSFIEHITSFANENNHAIGFGNDAEYVITHQDHPHVINSFVHLKLDHPPVNPSYYRQKNVHQLNLFCTEEEEIIYKQKYKDFKFVRWGNFGADVLPSSSSKALGIQKFIDHIGVPIEHTYAFGDGMNDIEMIRFVQNGIAMGNAVNELKEVASYITNDCDQDGILRGLQHYGLIEKSFSF